MFIEVEIELKVLTGARVNSLWVIFNNQHSTADIRGRNHFLDNF